jgi:hypothetical protein
MRTSQDVLTLIDELERRIRQQDHREAEVGRTMYRRGYLAGRAAQRRGAAVVPDPESRARGTAREMLR